MDISGGYAGSVSAIMNMIAQLSGSVSAIVFGVLVQGGHWMRRFISPRCYRRGAVVALFHQPRTDGSGERIVISRCCNPEKAAVKASPIETLTPA